MNAKQKLHQAQLASWASKIQDQHDSGLSIRDWCQQNNVSFHSYNYWKHILKTEYVDTVIHDIVAIPMQNDDHSQTPAVSTPQVPVPGSSNFSNISPDLANSYNSCDSYNSHDPNTLLISTAGVDITLSSSVSDDLILRLIKAVRYA